MPLWEAPRLIHAGIVLKPHSYLGWTKVAVLFEGLEESIRNGQYIFLNFDKKPVPYQVEGFRWLDEKTVLLKFRDADNEDAARRLSGREFYIAEDDLSEDALEEEDEMAQLIGYNLFDGEELVGEITEVNTDAYQTLLTVKLNEEREVLIPLHEDLVVELNPEAKELYLDLPEGLLEAQE